MSLNTFGDMTTDLGVRLSEPTASYWTEGERYDWLNQGQVDVANKLKCLQAEGKLTTVDGTYSYDTDNISSDLLTFLWAKIYDSGTTNWLDLTYKDDKWLDRHHPGWRNASSGTPQWYWHDKVSHTVYMHPKPSSVYEGTSYFWGRYNYRPTEMTNLSDIPQLPIEYRELPILYALARAFWKRGKNSVGNNYEALYQAKLNDIIADFRLQPAQEDVVVSYRRL